MNKRNFIMQAAIANMLLVSAAAYAITDLDAAAPVSTTFARELVASTATPLSLSNLGNALDITALTGYALSASEVRYARIEMDNGALFDAILLDAPCTLADARPGTIGARIASSDDHHASIARVDTQLEERVARVPAIL